MFWVPLEASHMTRCYILLVPHDFEIVALIVEKIRK